MTNKYKYFIANWKMFGGVKSVNLLNKVIKFSKLRKFKYARIIYCPPYTLLHDFVLKTKKNTINIGAQNCHHSEIDGPFTGFINSKMIKKIGCKYVIIGHSENRLTGENDVLLNRKIKSSLRNKLKIIFCIGETYNQKKNNMTKKILRKQILHGLKNIKNINNILFAYEPVWSIGSGIIPKLKDLKNNIIYIKGLLKKNFKLKNSQVLYGGSVSPNNIKELKKINEIDGFLVGGASQNPNKFIDIIKKTFN